MCGVNLEYNYCHLVDRGLVFCSIECLQENYEEIYQHKVELQEHKMTFGEAINKLKEGYKVRKIDWDKTHYIYMDEEGYVRRRDDKKYFIKLNNDVWEIYKQRKF